MPDSLGLDPCGSPDGFDKMSAFRKDGKPRKRNTYATTCGVCGATLAPGEGVIERRKDGSWGAACAQPG